MGKLKRTRVPKRLRQPRLPSEAKVTFVRPPAATVVEVYLGNGNLWRFRAKAKNHEIIAHGEGYARKWSAARGAVRVFPGAELRFLNTAPPTP